MMIGSDALRSTGGRKVLKGTHPNCVEARLKFRAQGCEFDGKISATRFRGDVRLYARANANEVLGGRAVQVASSENPEGPFGPFERVRFAGFPGDSERDANVYFGAVNPNPADGGASLFGLFPVHSVGARFDPPRAGNVSCIAGAFSCDGMRPRGSSLPSRSERGDSAEASRGERRGYDVEIPRGGESRRRPRRRDSAEASPVETDEIRGRPD